MTGSEWARLQGTISEFIENPLIVAKNPSQNICEFSDLRDREMKFPAQRNRESIRPQQGI